MIQLVATVEFDWTTPVYAYISLAAMSNMLDNASSLTT